MLETFYNLLGQIVIILLITIAILIVLALSLGDILIKKNILIFPRLILFIINTFHSTLKRILKLFKKNTEIIDIIGVKIMNQVNKEKFTNIPANKTLIFLPHCLRHRDCEAFLQEDGLKCTECGKCSIGIIKKKAEKKGYTIYIVPGSSFVKKIVKEKDFEATIGVACYSDLNQIMMVLSNFYPQGVLLTKTGCFETKVDIKTLLDLIDSKE